MQKNLFQRILPTCFLVLLASCAMTEKFLPNSEYNTLMVKADAAMRDGAWSKAAPLYEEAAVLKPNELDARLKQAQAYQNDGKLAQAFNIWQLIINSKAFASASNDEAKKQAKLLQTKSGFKLEPSVLAPETKANLPEIKKPALVNERDAQENKTQENKIPAHIPSVNADTHPVPAVEPKQLAKIDANKAVLDTLSAWREAWLNKKLSTYYAVYVDDFAGDLVTANEWRAQRKAKILGAKNIKITLSEVQVNVISDELAEVDFKQTYQSGSYKDSGKKTMQMKKQQDRWLITQESFK